MDISTKNQTLRVALSSVPTPKIIGICQSAVPTIELLLRNAFPKATFVPLSVRWMGDVYCKANSPEAPLAFDMIWAGPALAGFDEEGACTFFESALALLSPQGCLLVATYGEDEATRMREDRKKIDNSFAARKTLDFIAHGYSRGLSVGQSECDVTLVALAWFEAVFDGSPLSILAYLSAEDDCDCDLLILRRTDQKVATQQPKGERSNRSNDHGFSADTSFQPPPRQEPPLQFDDHYYCATYPDVAAAVSQGIFESGAEHYVAFGWKEGRQPFDPSHRFAKRSAPRPSAWVGGSPGGMLKVNEAWSVSPEQQSIDYGWYWLAHPTVRARTNRLASGCADEDAYGQVSRLFRARGMQLPLGRAVSIGCGFGALERDLSRRGIVRVVDAYDIAHGAITEARRLAEAEGLDGLRYHIANLEVLGLEPRSVDAVFAHSSVHHVEKLEALYATVWQALRPDGLFHLNEYIGPTRFQWTDEQLTLSNAFLDSLPDRLRRLPSGHPKPALVRPTIQEMIDADPSEAIRSAELVPLLRPYFNLLEFRPLGGTLCHIALGGIAQNFDPSSDEDESFLQALFRMEDTAMADGRIRSDFAVITAVPRPQVALPVPASTI